MKIHYHSDHLGSASFVTNRGGGVVQHLQYLPYGELFVSQRNSEEFDSRYKFTAKELDNETSYTYFGARYYDSELSAWLSVDPMSDKYPSLSPYCYTANNPVVLVDPNGMDIWEINDQGEIVSRTEDKSQDAFYIVAKDENGDYQRTYTTNAEGEKEYNSISFEYGTIESQRTIAINSTSSYDVYQVRGDDNGTALFNFLSNNVTGSPSQVEFSQAMTGIAEDKGLNFITTSHERRKESGMMYLLNGQLLNGYTIRELNHSHPVSRTPSGSDVPGSLSGDLGFAKIVKDILRAKGQSIPKFHIYHVPSQTKIPYAQ